MSKAAKTPGTARKRPAIRMPTLKEDAAIRAAARSDPDAQPLTDAQLRKMVPLASVRHRSKPLPAPAQRYASVWDAIEDTPEEAESMKLRAKLMRAVQQRLQSAGLPQRDAARLIGVTQPRVSDLMRGRIELFSVEALIDMLMRLGLRVDLRIRQAA